MSDTRVDLTGCAPWSVQNLVIELNADLVVFVSDLRKVGDMTVFSGNAPGDETRHTLYLVAPPRSGQVICDAWTNTTAIDAAPGINFNTSGWSQKDPSDGKIRTKVLLYSASVINLRSALSNSFSGQIYGCGAQVMKESEGRLWRAGASSSSRRAGV